MAPSRLARHVAKQRSADNTTPPRAPDRTLGGPCVDPRTTRMAAYTPLAMSARGGLLVPPRAAAHTATGRAHPVVAPAVGTRVARAVAARAAETPAESPEDALEDVRERDPTDRGRALRPRAPRASRRAMLAAPPALSLGMGLGAVSLGQPASARGAAAPGVAARPSPAAPPPPFAPAGIATLRDPTRYNGLATADRAALGLDGLLPVATTTPELEVARASAAVDACESPMTKYRTLVGLLNTDERTFYALLRERTADLLPVLYTPTVGDACLQYGTLTQRPPGLTVSLNDLGSVGKLLASWPRQNVRVAVITDGERILGLGDQGANGMGISAGKSMVYAACGLNPEWLLPIQLDTGTNNETLLNDPLYVGDRRKRERGETYDALLDELVDALKARYGEGVLVHFEDFAPRNAFRVLQRFRETRGASTLVINDDIQGTAAVTVAGASAACRAVGAALPEQSVVFFGAGQANVGAANLLTLAMREADATLSIEDARKRVVLVDSKGLVYDGRPADSKSGLSPDKAPFAAHLPTLVKRNAGKTFDPTSLADVVKATRCSLLVGAAAVPGAFTETVVAQMAAQNERPIVFALSNPTSKAECTAAQAYAWSGGRAVYASGTKFPDQAVVREDGVSEQRRPGFANNAFIFPGVALGALASGASAVTDEMFLAAALALAGLVSEEDLKKGAVYPPTSTIREAAVVVAAAVAAAAAEGNVARPGACAGGAVPEAGGRTVPSLDAVPGENDVACVNWEACVRDYAKTCL